MPVPPERDLKGKWLDELTGLFETKIKGIHLRLPGYDDSGRRRVGGDLHARPGR